MASRGKPRTAVTGRHEYTSEQSLDWVAPQSRAMLDTMPADWRHDTLQRARMLAKERPRSYLAKHFRRLYGEDLEQGGDGDECVDQ